MRPPAGRTGRHYLFINLIFLKKGGVVAPLIFRRSTSLDGVQKWILEEWS